MKEALLLLRVVAENSAFGVSEGCEMGLVLYKWYKWGKGSNDSFLQSW